MKRAVWWIKRDFRLADNKALVRALEENEAVLPVFVFEPALIRQPDYSPMHVWAWRQALEDLKARTQALEGDIMVATGDVLDVFTKLKSVWDFTDIYAHEETGNDWTFQRDKSVIEWCQQQQVLWHEIPQNGVIRRLKSREDRQPIIKDRLFNTPPLAAPKTLKFPTSLRTAALTKEIPPLSQFFDLAAYPQIQWNQLQKVSETAAQKDLASWLTERGIGYAGGISSPNTAFTHGSRLSVHLAWGTVSLRQVFASVNEKRLQIKDDKSDDAKQWRRSLRGMTARLHWHDHFMQRLESAPLMEFQALNPAYMDISYEDDPTLLRAWCEGRTGFPMIDACMRCLAATGFMNFRMRAMVVSFACFGLHLSWKTIHPHLAQVFLDYEPGIHLSQLQMQAGIVGINTVRVYSPTKQITDQDPQCEFIKYWIPELRDFTSTEIMSYEKIPLGDYPRPIVDFKLRSKRMKDQIFAIRKSLKGKEESAKVLKNHGSRKRPRKKAPTKQRALF